jgi:hypothetical protein
MHATDSRESDLASRDAQSRIGVLDPLTADHVLAHLPVMNARADVPALARALTDLLPSDELLSRLDTDECVAAMRDIGMFLGSLRRHDVEPADVVAGLEPVLVELGRRTRMVPRDTVYHYTSWNPVGDRRRLYTGDAEESLLIDAPRMTLGPLADAVALCRHLSVVDIDNADTPIMLSALAVHVRSFDESMRMLRGRVTPEYFAHTMRPYFQAVRVAGQSYFGPAASHVPLFLVDLVVWAADRSAPDHTKYQQDAIPYLVPSWRPLPASWAASPSVVSRLDTALRGPAPSTAVAARRHAAAAACADVLRALIEFRGKHVVFARKAYGPSVGLYPKGAGGGTLDLLGAILDLTRQNRDLVAGHHR